MAPKVLVILTSHEQLGDSGKKTGWYLPELAHPYDVLTEAGYEVVVASPAGGKAPLDANSVEAFKEDASSVNFLKEHASVWEQTAKLSEFVGRTDDFAAVFVPGGHGPMFDLATDPTSQAIIADFASKGKPVAAVCHGPAAFVNVRLPSGDMLLAGKKVTGFSNAEEDAMDLSRYMPFMLETKMNEVSGGGFDKAPEMWGAKVIVDGLVITGQNPASAKGTGEAIVKAIKG